ncbi:MAG TPA: hypothetical protein VNJ03_16340 [Vicinamibacterales bacterium]|nr:hypothetical protein [Vicinamibacterales bacterium]
MKRMNASRLVAWIAGVGLLGAWFASAAGVPRTAGAYRAPQRPAEAAELDRLAADVQAQAGRLRTRLASAPTPQAAIRNPFDFSAPAPAPIVRRSPSRVSTPIAIELPAFMAAPEPALELIGIAENQAPKGMVRTAMISSPQGDLLMVTAGQRILGTYDVVAIGADAVELKQVSTGVIRRLALR